MLIKQSALPQKQGAGDLVLHLQSVNALIWVAVVLAIAVIRSYHISQKASLSTNL